MYRLLFICTLLLSSPLHAKWFTLNTQLDDQELRIEIWQTDANRAKQLLAEVGTEAERLHNLISPQRAQSEISQLNRLAPHRAVTVSQELYQLLLMAERWSVDTKGSFDLTQIGPGQLNPAIDYKYLITEPPSQVRYLDYRLQLDITPFASGYIVDKLKALLSQKQVRCAWVQYGQAVRVLGSRYGMPWQIDIANRGAMFTASYTFPLINSAIVTAGAIGLKSEQEEHRVLQDQHRHTHSRSEESGLIGVIALAYDGVDAAIYANSIMALGKEEGLKQVNKNENVEAILIDKFNTVHYSQGLD